MSQPAFANQYCMSARPGVIHWLHHSNTNRRFWINRSTIRIDPFVNGLFVPSQGFFWLTESCEVYRVELDELKKWVDQVPANMSGSDFLNLLDKELSRFLTKTDHVWPYSNEGLVASPDGRTLGLMSKGQPLLYDM